MPYLRFLASEITKDQLLSLVIKRKEFAESMINIGQSESLKYFHTELLTELLKRAHRYMCQLISNRLSIVNRMLSMAYRKKFEFTRGISTNYSLYNVYSHITDNVKIQMRKLFMSNNNNDEKRQSPVKEGSRDLGLLRSNTQKYFLVNQVYIERSSLCYQEAQD